MAGAGAGAGAAAAGAVAAAAMAMAKVVMEVANSSHFDRKQIESEKLTLSQGFCLLWQNAETGDVGGRKVSAEANSGATAAVLLDLIVRGRFEIEVEANTTMGVKNDHIRLKVVDATKTGTYLDEVPLVEEILKHHEEKPEKRDKVYSWIFNDISRMKAGNKSSTKTLDSLVDLGILEKKEKFIGCKFPTLKPEYEENLEKQIRAVVLDDVEPSSYIRVLLTLARCSDNLMLLYDPVLKKHFSKEEYGKAKEKINALVGIDKK